MATKTSNPAANAGSPASFLQNAPRKFVAIQGTVPIGSGAGNTSVTWVNSIPILPAYCTAMHLNIQQEIELTFAANGDGAYISPYAPYSGWNHQMTLGGAPPWPATELTPWFLDDIAARCDYDPSYPGLGGVNSGYPASNYLVNVLDTGLAGWVDTIGSNAAVTSLTSAASSDYINPGSYITNNFAGAATLTLTANFNVQLRFQRKRHLLWGAIPFGDPENRPNNLMQLLPIVGINPEQCVVVSPTTNSAAIVGVLSAAATVTATYELAYIDLLPAGAQVPEPTVGFGLQLTPASITGLAAGTNGLITHRTAQAYTQIHHILVNGGTGATPAYAKPIQSSYFALWDDQDPQSARWSFDTTVNTFHLYFDQFLRIKRRLPPIGYYLADFENGIYPEIPSVDPYDAIMSPDATYAQAFGVPVTPAMTTVVRVPVGVTAVLAYVRYYAFGLVKVPY